MTCSNYTPPHVRLTYGDHVVRVELGRSNRRGLLTALRQLRAILRAEKMGLLPPRPEPLVRDYTDSMDDEQFALAVIRRAMETAAP